MRVRASSWWILAIVALGVVVVGIVGAREPAADARPQPTATGHDTDAQQAIALLDTIRVKGRAAKTGYQRSQFGSGWATIHGCDARNRTLARDLSNVTYRRGTNRCIVTTGTLKDSYSGHQIPFIRGEQTSQAVAVDHRYPLALAWQQGAQQWSPEQRRSFANDLDNLQAVDGPTNSAKGASGPGSWLPPNKSYRCQYVINFITVTAKWRLTLNPGDRNMSHRILTKCVTK